MSPESAALLSSSPGPIADSPHQVPSARPLRIADVTLFYGERSGGIRTYLDAKADFAKRTGAFEHHLVVPGRATGQDWPEAAQRHEQRSLEFNPRFAFWRCWRGPSWGNTSWLLVPAMRELGYEQEAARVVVSLEHAADRHGFREYYNPITGRGLAARGFGFATLLVDLVSEPEMNMSDAAPMIQS